MNDFPVTDRIEQERKGLLAFARNNVVDTRLFRKDLPRVEADFWPA
jgi:hypothetical protein